MVSVRICCDRIAGGDTHAGGFLTVRAFFWASPPASAIRSFEDGFFYLFIPLFFLLLLTFFIAFDFFYLLCRAIIFGRVRSWRRIVEKFRIEGVRSRRTQRRARKVWFEDRGKTKRFSRDPFASVSGVFGSDGSGVKFLNLCIDVAHFVERVFQFDKPCRRWIVVVFNQVFQHGNDCVFGVDVC